MEKLVEQEIRCRIIKLDVAEEDVVVDRRAIAEDEERAGKERRYSELKEGDTVQGEIRSLTDYGAFVDIGGATPCFMLAKFHGVASTSRLTCSPRASRSRPESSRSTRKSIALPSA